MLGKMLEIEELKNTPVIMLTAESGRDNVMNIVKMGVKDYIVKPFKGPQLLERVMLILPDIKKQISLAGGQLEGESDALFDVIRDIVVLNLPAKITRNKSTQLETMVQEKIEQMEMAETNKMIVSLSKIENFSMTAIQAVLNLVNHCLRAKLSLRLIATEPQKVSLQEFKEASVIPIMLSLEEAVADY